MNSDLWINSLPSFLVFYSFFSYLIPHQGEGLFSQLPTFNKLTGIFINFKASWTLLICIKHLRHIIHISLAIVHFKMWSQNIQAIFVIYTSQLRMNMWVRYTTGRWTYKKCKLVVVFLHMSYIKINTWTVLHSNLYRIPCNKWILKYICVLQRNYSSIMLL